MSQSDFGNLSSPLSGSTFINTHLEPFRDALHTMHSGTSRPSYAVAGLLWLDTTSTPWIVKQFDGTDDITWGTVNATTNTFTPAGNLVPYTAPTTTVGGSIALAEGTTNGTNTASMKAPDNLASNAVLTLPSTTGTLATLAGTETLTNKTLNQPNIVGVTNGSNAAAGSVGELLSAKLLAGSAVSLTSGVSANVTSVVLTAGDWDIEGVVVFRPAATTTITSRIASISLTTTAIHRAAGEVGHNALIASNSGAVGAFDSSVNTGRVRIPFGSSTTVFLVASSNFGTSTMSAFGEITARRVR